MNQAILVLSTVPDMKTGESLAETLVRERLAACVTVTADARSFYWWDGEISRDAEHVLMIKTRADLFSALEKRLRELHPYEVPEIVGLPIVLGSEPYLRWIETETGKRRNPPPDSGFLKG